MVLKNLTEILAKISVTKIFQKVFSFFENGQKKMSKIEKPKKVLKKTLVHGVCDENAHKSDFWSIKSVTINFKVFSQKLFKEIFC